MRRREWETHCWSLEVYEHSQGKVFDIPFAEIGPNLEALPENWRVSSNNHGSACVRSKMRYRNIFL
jgi:hypothetical protein